MSNIKSRNIDEKSNKYSKTSGKIFLTKTYLDLNMAETTCEKIKRCCMPCTYAFSFSHIKSVVISMLTEYESKFFTFNKNKICDIHFLFSTILSTKNCYYSFIFNSINMPFCTITYIILCICLFNVV